MNKTTSVIVIDDRTSRPSFPENTPKGTWYFDMIHDRLYLSDETFLLFGIEKNSALSYYGTFFYTIIHPGDRHTWLSYWDQIIETHIPLTIEHRIVLKTGEIRYIRQRIERLADIGNRLKWLRGTVESLTYEAVTYFAPKP